MKKLVVEIAKIAAIAVITIIFIDLTLSDEKKDIYYDIFSVHFNNVLQEDTSNQGLAIGGRYNEVFHEADGLTYSTGE